MRSSSLLALTLSLSLAAPMAAQAAGERRARGPILVTPGEVGRVVVNAKNEVRPGVVLVTTGDVKGGQPVLQVTTAGALTSAGYERKVALAKRIFHPIMAGTHDKTKERVVKRGNGWVAFLASGDPRHPMTQDRLADSLRNQNGAELDPDTVEDLMADHGFEGSSIPFGQRAHLLVLPTTPRAYMGAGTDYESSITEADHELISSLRGIAKSLGTELNLAQPKIWQNAPTRTSMGQTHIHLTGAYTLQTRLPDLEAPSGGRPAQMLTIDRGKVVPMGADGLPASGTRR